MSRAAAEAAALGMYARPPHRQRSDVLKDLHIAGIGQEFWVGEDAGYSPDDQSALIQYLLPFEPRRE
jgi:hypothetical protein